MVYVLLLSAGVICSICFQANGHCTTPECTDASEGIDEILVTISLMLSGCVQENGQCMTSDCRDSSTATDEIDHCRNTSIVCDCSDIKANGYTASGVYRIYVVDEGQRYYSNASCDMTTTNGPWTVFQRRKDDSVDFYREWNEYANGFGNPNGEFWLGKKDKKSYKFRGRMKNPDKPGRCLKSRPDAPDRAQKEDMSGETRTYGNYFLHLLTSKRRYRLRIDLEDFEGEKRYAEYSTFNISSSADKYRLRIGNYSGTAGDSLRLHNDQRFSTKDNDNLNCAVKNRGAWWYSGCHNSNLNGLYLHGHYLPNGSFTGYEGVHWTHWRGPWYSLKTSEMKISSP